MVIMILLLRMIGKALSKARQAMLKQTDARVKLASEIITGVCDQPHMAAWAFEREL